MDIIKQTLQEYLNVDLNQLTNEQRNELDKFIQANETDISLLLHCNNKSVNSIKIKTYLNSVKLKNYLNELKKNSFSSEDEKFIFIKLNSKNQNKENHVLDEEENYSKIIFLFKNQTNLLNILNELSKFSNFEKLMNKIKDERIALIDKIMDWANNCFEYLDNESDILLKLQKLAVNRSKITSVIKLSDELFNDLEDHYNKLLKELQQIKYELNLECNSCFQSWCNQVSLIEFKLNSQCIKFNEETQVPYVTYDQRLLKFMNDYRLLVSLNFQMPKNLIKLNSDAILYLDIAKELSNIINFYCTIGDQILISQRPMLIEPAKRFTSLLESKYTISWSQDELELKDWLKKLKNFCFQFENENRILRKYHQDILNLMLKLFETEFNQWNSILQDINTIILEVDNKYSNSFGWCNHWNVQLYKILNLFFKKSIQNCDQWLGKFSNDGEIFFFNKEYKFKVDLVFISNKVSFRPTYNKLREIIYKRINKFLSIPANFKGIKLLQKKDTFSEDLFCSIIYENSYLIELLYIKAEEILKELNDIINEFKEWTCLYYVIKEYGPDLLEKKLDNSILSNFLNDLKIFKSNFRLLKNKSQNFNRNYLDNEFFCIKSNIVINLAPIKIFIEWLHLEMNKILVSLLTKSIELEVNNLKDKQYNILEKIEKSPNSYKELIEFENLVIKNELDKNLVFLNDQLISIKEKNNFLLKWNADNVINISNIQYNQNKLNQFFQNKIQYFDSFTNLLKFSINDRIKKYEEDLIMFNSKWSKLQLNNQNKNFILNNLFEEYEKLNLYYEDIYNLCNYFNICIPSHIKEEQIRLKEFAELNSKLKILTSFDLEMEIFYDMEWIIARNKLNQIHEFIENWLDKNKNIKEKFVFKKIDDLKQTISLLKICKGEFFVKSHWNELFDLLNLNTKEFNYETLKLSELLNKKNIIINNKKKIKELNHRALGEMSIRETLNEIDQFFEKTKFDLTDYTLINGKKIKLIKNWYNIINKLGECILTIQSVKSTNQIQNNELTEKIFQWEQRLLNLDNIINLLIKVQRKWTYLEPIYTKNSVEMFNQNSFEVLSSQFLELIKKITDDCYIIKLIGISFLDSKLIELNENLSKSQKKLIQFMEDSRDRFPRFYFLSDDDLLLILAGKIDLSSSGLIRKLFNNSIAKLHLNSQNEIVSLESIEGEIVKLKNSVKINNDQGAIGIEIWLNKLTDEIKITLENQFLNIINEKEEDLKLLNCENYCLQIFLIKKWLYFTQKIEESIKQNNFECLKNELEKKLIDFTNFKNNKKLKTLEQIKVKSLILDTIHFLAIIDELIEKKDLQLNIQSWLWQKQLRYYVSKDKKSEEKLIVCMGCSKISYSFEYLGCLNKLVHTTLTDKCFLTCMQALSFGLGGNPYGPAGTGKTESIKSLGQHLGRQVLVFNCDENVDVSSITRILIGLVKCGFWGCFDEFNRLKLNVLSALSTHIQTIQTALKNFEKDYFELKISDKRIFKIKCNRNSSLFVTLNPVSKQYKARNRLPDNLKTLFLPIAMNAPEICLISTAILLAEGFDFSLSHIFGKKIELFFKLADKNFSRQIYYDWGLRAIKSFLNSVGHNLKKHRLKNTNLTVGDEAIIFLQNLYSQIKPKLTFEDQELFNQLVQDIFSDKNILPTIHLKKFINYLDYSNFRIFVEQAFDKMKLIKNEDQIIKVLQLNEQINTRLGVALIGDSGVGKSTIWKLLIEALNLKQNLVHYTYIPLSPKALDRNELLGYINKETNEWIDGLFSLKTREIILNQNEMNKKYFIIFDGEIEPSWVEALNSVLDDNQVLTLPTGERIDFNLKNIHLLFETVNLKFVSPATISRLGIICISQVKNNFYLQNELKQFNDIKNVNFDDISKSIIHLPISLKLSRCKTIIHILNTIKNQNEDLNINLEKLIQNNFEFPDMLEEYYFIEDGQLCITKSRYKTLGLAKLLICQNKHLLLEGKSGSGKHMILNYGCQLNKEFRIYINCLPNLKSKDVLKKIKKQCALINQGCKKILKSPIGNKLVIYVNHLDVLEEDEWQCKQFISFLNGLLTYNGCYDLENGEWIDFDNFQLICTVSNLSLLPNKFINLLNVIQLPYPSLDEILLILKASLNNELEWKTNYINIYMKIVKLLLEQIQKKFINEKNNYNSRNVDSFNILLCAFKAFKQLERYKKIEEFIIHLEIYNSICSELDLNYHSLLKIIFKQSFENFFQNLNNIYITAEYYNGELFTKNYNDFEQYWRLVINNWCNEFEFQKHKIFCMPDYMKTISFVTCFLSEEELDVVKCAFLIGPHGSGRTFISNLVSFNLNYDQIWSIKEPFTENQLLLELRTLFNLDLNNINNSKNEVKKILILLDETHFQLMPYLQQILYFCVCEFNELSLKIKHKNLKISVKIIIICTKISNIDKTLWDGMLTIKYIEEYSNISLQLLTEQLIEDSYENNNYQESDENLEKNEIEKIANLLIKTYDFFKEIIIKNYRIYFHLIDTFKFIMSSKKNNLDKKRDHLIKGIQKLEESKNQVNSLKHQAQIQQNQLINKKKEAEQALELITNSVKSSETHQEEIQVVRTLTEKESKNIEKRRAIINEQLTKIEPQLLEANRAVNSIKSEQLNEIRSLRAPPEIIRDILEAVLRLLGNLDTSWNAMKIFLSKRGVKDELLNFDCRKVTSENLIKVKNLLSSKSNSFNLNAARRASIAAYPLADWVKAVIAYTTVLQQVEPLEKELSDLKNNLKKAELRIDSLNSELKNVSDNVQTLKQKLNSTTIEAAEIELEFKKTKKILEKSQNLVEELSDEYLRWTQQSKQIDELNRQLINYSLIASIYITFCLCENAIEQKEIIIKNCNKHLNLNYDEFININQILIFLECENEQEIVFKYGNCYFNQLIVDPGNQFLNFLNQYSFNLEKSNIERNKSISLNQLVSSNNKKSKRFSVNSLANQNLFSLNTSNFEILNLMQIDFLKVLELCIRFGKIVILDAFDGFNCSNKKSSYLNNYIAIYSLLKNNIYGSDDFREFIYLGNKRLDYNENFKIYFYNSQINYKSENNFLNYLSIVNFFPNVTNTMVSFLSLIIQVRKPDLEHQKNELEQNKKLLLNKLKILEDELLVKLNECKSNLIKNEDLIDSLRKTKNTSKKINNSLNQIFELSEKLNKERNQFKFLSEFASKLYLILIKLKKLNCAYQINILEFEQLFTNSLKNDLNLDIIKLLKIFYNYFISMLETIDKQIFFNYLKLELKDYDTLRGFNFNELNENTPNLEEYIMSNSNRMKNRPFLILTKPGNTPLNELEKIAIKMNLTKLDFISLNDDILFDTENKLKKLNENNEQMICINNLHLFIDWLPKLTKICLDYYQFQSDSVSEKHQNSIIILISENDVNLPNNLLELSCKYTYQETIGLKSQLNKLINELDKNSNNLNLIKFTYLHVICNERQNYLPIGWIKNYEFGLNEYYNGLKLIQFICDEKNKKKIINKQNENDFVCGLLLNIIYGSRLDTNFDFKILKCLIDKFFNNIKIFKKYDINYLNEKDEFDLLSLPLNITKWKKIVIDEKIKIGLDNLINLNENKKKNFKIEKLNSLINELSKFNNNLKNKSFNKNNIIDNFFNFQYDIAKHLIHKIFYSIQNPNKQDFIKLTNNQTPENWFNFWPYGSNQADKFIFELTKLIESLQNQNQKIMKFNLNGIFNPFALLSVIKQEASHFFNVNIDDLELKVISNSNGIIGSEKKSFKLNINGISLAGAILNNKILTKCNLDSEFKQKLSNLELEVVLKNKTINKKDKSFIKIPLFCNEDRENLIDYFEFECEQSTEDYWILTSTALVIEY